MREFSGIEVDWGEGAHATHYDVLVSEDGADWRRVRQAIDGDGGRDALYLPETDARFVRFDLGRANARAYALANVRFHPPDWAATPNAYIEAIGQTAPRGAFPRGFLEQSYWTLVGADAAADSALISEDGAVEIGKGGFSIEPFVRAGARTFGWADVEIAHALEEGYLPIPSVRWSAPGWTLTTTAFAEGNRERSTLVTRYALTNTGAAPQTLDLILAARPFQVNGPRQFLNRQGGVSPIQDIALAGGVLAVNRRPRVWFAQAPNAARASRFDSGLAPFAAQGSASAHDETGFASAAVAYRVSWRPAKRAHSPGARRLLAKAASAAAISTRVRPAWRKLGARGSTSWTFAFPKPAGRSPIRCARRSRTS